MDNENLPIQISIIVTEKNNLPCIELRKSTNDINLIKSIITAASQERPLMILPTFRDKMKSLSSLCEKGILHKKKNEFYFTV